MQRREGRRDRRRHAPRRDRRSGRQARSGERLSGAVGYAGPARRSSSACSASICRSTNGRRKRASPTRRCSTRIERRADEHMAGKVAQWGPDVIRYVEKSILLQTLDHLWREHLRDARASAPGDRAARLRPARSAQRVQGGSLQPVRDDDRQSLREAVTAQLMRVEIVAAPPPEQQPAPLPYMEAHKIDPTTGEDELAMARGRARCAARAGGGNGNAHAARRRAIRRIRRAGARSAATSPALAARARNTSTATGGTLSGRHGQIDGDR